MIFYFLYVFSLSYNICVYAKKVHTESERSMETHSTYDIIECIILLYNSMELFIERNSIENIIVSSYKIYNNIL